MPDPLGLSFMPGENGSDDPNRPQPTPIQQAIQTLSLRIPRVAGAASGAPQALLTAPGGGAVGGSPDVMTAILDQIRRRMMFGQVPITGPGGPIPPGGPMPPPSGPFVAPGTPIFGKIPNPNVGFDPNRPSGGAAPEPGGAFEKPNLPPPPAPMERMPPEPFERGPKRGMV